LQTSESKIMKRISVGGLVLSGSLALVVAAGPAFAQRAGQAPRAGQLPRPYPPTAQSAPYSSALPQFRGRPHQPKPYIRELPPEPLGPNSLGLLEREFQYMRRTAPYPDRFLYGRWNPRYEVVTPPVTSIPYGGGYYYPGGYYSGYVNPYPFGYGYGAYGYLPNNVPGTVVQQEVVVVQDRARELQQSGALKDTPRTPSSPRVEKPGSKEQLGDFYLGGSKQLETISDALDDIRKAWLNGDVARLTARFQPDGKVRVYPKGEYRYTVEVKEFTSMLKDAMTKIDTISFEFDRPKAEEAGHVLVTGVHTFVDADKEKRTTYVSYGLERVGGKWLITQAGSSVAPILKHQD
jgi:hypothetical protein